MYNYLMTMEKKPNKESNEWLRRLHAVILKNSQNPQISNQTLAKEMGTSERHLSRKVKEQSGLPPQKYLRKYRLQLAMKYLEEGTFRTVKETSFAIGYINVSYFILQFEKEFGVKPYQILKERGWR